MIKNINSVEYSKLSKQELHHGAFIRKGRMIAQELCFDGMTSPIDANSSYITALAFGNNDILYGGTSGAECHIFAAMTKWGGGMVIDFGGISDSKHCLSITCTNQELVAAVVGPDGSKLLVRPLLPVPFDSLQEWFINSETPQTVYRSPGTLSYLVPNPKADGIFGLANGKLFRWNNQNPEQFKSEKWQFKAICVDGDRQIYGINEIGKLTILDVSGKNIRIISEVLLKGNFSGEINFGVNPNLSGIYLADSEGSIFFISAIGQTKKISKSHLQPINCMTMANDGSLLGFCGKGIAEMFILDSSTGTYQTNGCAVSVLNRRRYGYCFAAAVTHSDGEIFWGENDRGGHLWWYFPATQVQTV
jgi:hypothetical protein